jgi:hypothetical protein
MGTLASGQQPTGRTARSVSRDRPELSCPWKPIPGVDVIDTTLPGSKPPSWPMGRIIPPPSPYSTRKPIDDSAECEDLAVECDAARRGIRSRRPQRHPRVRLWRSSRLLFCPAHRISLLASRDRVGHITPTGRVQADSAHTFSGRFRCRTSTYAYPSSCRTNPRSRPKLRVTL